MNTTRKPWRWLTAIAATVGLALTACNDSDDVVSPAPNPDAPAVTTAIDSKTVSAGEAIDVAGTFRYGDKAVAGRSGADPAPITGSDGSVVAYIVNFDEGGWVIVSAKRSYFPILAHAEAGSFSLDDVSDNEGLAMWIDETIHAIELSESLEAETAAQIALDWLEYEPQTLAGSSGIPTGNSPEAVACRNRLKELNETYYQDGWSFTTLKAAPYVVANYIYNDANAYNSPEEYTIVGVKTLGTRTKLGPLMTTEWDQLSNFNAQCPLKDNSSTEHRPAGCATIAVAQIMKYHKFPVRYNWDAMNEKTAKPETQELIAEIRRNIKVRNSDNGANIDDVADGMRKYYNYSVTKKDYSAEAVTSGLTIFGPVYMRGENPYGDKHAWVCDGADFSTHEYEYYVEFLTANNTYDNYYLSSIEDPKNIRFESTFYQFHHNWGRVSYKVNSNEEPDPKTGWFQENEWPKYDENGKEENYTYSKARKILIIKPNK